MLEFHVILFYRQEQISLNLPFDWVCLIITACFYITAGLNIPSKSELTDFLVVCFKTTVKSLCFHIKTYAFMDLLVLLYRYPMNEGCLFLSYKSFALHLVYPFCKVDPGNAIIPTLFGCAFVYEFSHHFDSDVGKRLDYRLYATAPETHSCHQMALILCQFRTLQRIG